MVRPDNAAHDLDGFFTVRSRPQQGTSPWQRQKPVREGEQEDRGARSRPRHAHHDHDERITTTTKAPSRRAKTAAKNDADVAKARERHAAAGRNDPLPVRLGQEVQEVSPRRRRGRDVHAARTAGRQGAADRTAGACSSSAARAPPRRSSARRSAADGDPAGRARRHRDGAALGRQHRRRKGGAQRRAGRRRGADRQAAREGKARDAFEQPELQPFIRAAHALGCLAYDEERYADAVKDLDRVHRRRRRLGRHRGATHRREGAHEAGEGRPTRSRCSNRRRSWKAAPRAPTWVSRWRTS